MRLLMRVALLIVTLSVSLNGFSESLAMLQPILDEKIGAIVRGQI